MADETCIGGHLDPVGDVDPLPSFAVRRGAYGDPVVDETRYTVDLVGEVVSEESDLDVPLGQRHVELLRSGVYGGNVFEVTVIAVFVVDHEARQLPVQGMGRILGQAVYEGGAAFDVGAVEERCGYPRIHDVVLQEGPGILEGGPAEVLAVRIEPQGEPARLELQCAIEEQMACRSGERFIGIVGQETGPE